MNRLAVLALVLLSPGLAEQQRPANAMPSQCSDLTSINALTDALEKRRSRMPVRTFSAEFDEPEIWREKPSPEGGLLARVYSESGKPTIAVFEISSESGDWLLVATYYYRGDATLAKKHEILNTFYGSASVLRDTVYDCSGRVVSKSARHLDLKTKQEKAPDPEFVDEASPEYKHIKQLPFASILAKRQ